MKAAGWEGPSSPARFRRRALLLGAVAAVGLLLALAALVTRQDATTLQIESGGGLTDRRYTDPVDPDDLRPERLPPVTTSERRDGSGPLLPDAPALTVVAADDSGLQLVSLATGDYRRIEIMRPSTASLGQRLMVVDGTIIVEADNDVVAVPRGTLRPTRLAANHRVVASTANETVWVVDSVNPYVRGTVSHIDLRGNVLGQVEVPAIAAPIVGTDDGLVVSAPGAISFASGDAEIRFEHIASGLILASDGDQLAWLRCSDDLSCAILLGTLDDPERVTTTLDPAVLPAGFFGLPPGAFSPDGRLLALPLYTPRDRQQLGEVSVSVIDTATGAEIRRETGSSLTPIDTPLAWSPDSRFLVFLSRADVRVWDVERNEVIDLDTDLRAVRALAVR